MNEDFFLINCPLGNDNQNGDNNTNPKNTELLQH